MPRYKDHWSVATSCLTVTLKSTVKIGHPGAMVTFAEEEEFIFFDYVSSMFYLVSDPFMT